MLRHSHSRERQLVSCLSMHGGSRRKNRLTQLCADAFPRRSISAGSRSFVHVSSPSSSYQPMLPVMQQRAIRFPGGHFVVIWRAFRVLWPALLA
jgi:hypothetical protein